MALGVSVPPSPKPNPIGEPSSARTRRRGIGIPDRVTSDAHEGLKAALRATFTAIPWQHCRFHLQQNAQAYVPQLALRASVAADIRGVFNSQDLPHAEARLAGLVVNYEKTAPAPSTWMKGSIPEGLTVLRLVTAILKIFTEKKLRGLIQPPPRMTVHHQ